MNNGEIIALLHRIATSLERIADHIEKPEPQPRQKIAINCEQCKGTGYMVGPGHDGYKNHCFSCRGSGQIIKSV